MSMNPRKQPESVEKAYFRIHRIGTNPDGQEFIELAPISEEEGRRRYKLAMEKKLNRKGRAS